MNRVIYEPPPNVEWFMFSSANLHRPRQVGSRVAAASCLPLQDPEALSFSPENPTNRRATSNIILNRITPFKPIQQLLLIILLDLFLGVNEAINYN